MPTIKLKKGRGFAKLAGAGLIDRKKVQALKQGKTAELSVEEVSWLKPGIYEEEKSSPKPKSEPEPKAKEEESKPQEETGKSFYSKKK